MSYWYRLLLLSAVLWISSCESFQYMDSSGDANRYLKPILLVDDDEPGMPLLIQGIVKDRETDAVIAHAEIYIYHADDGGAYQASDAEDESTARLHAVFKSDEEGKFAFKTILPGEYPDTPPGNRHIHIHYVRASGYQETGKLVLFVHNVNDEVRKWAEETGFGVIIDVVEDQDGLLVGQLPIYLDRE